MQSADMPEISQYTLLNATVVNVLLVLTLCYQ